MVIFVNPSLLQETIDRLLQPLHPFYLQGINFDLKAVACQNSEDVQPIGCGRPGAPNFVRFLNVNLTIGRLKLALLALIPPSEITLP